MAEGSRRDGGRVARWICFFLGFWFVLLAAQEGCYRSYARPTSAIVVAKHWPPRTKSRASPSIRYRFVDAEGKSVEDDSDVLPDAWRALEIGGPVEVEVIPGFRTSRVAGQTASLSTWVALATLFVGGGIVIGRKLRPTIEIPP